MNRRRIRLGWLALCFALAACGTDPTQRPPEKPMVPRGYVDRLEFQVDDRVLSFGPFVGYYFKPASGNDLSQLDFLCFNERSFYTRDLPAGALLYSAQAHGKGPVHLRHGRTGDTGQPAVSPGGTGAGQAICTNHRIRSWPCRLK